MKKGFTLIELLVVMIIVGILVAVAVPKYNASVERSRSLEGILNLEKLSEEANAMFVVNNGKYPTEAELNAFADEGIKSQYFAKPTVSRTSDTAVSFSTLRKSGSGYSYSLTVTNENGEPKVQTSSGGQKYTVGCQGTTADCNIVWMNLLK